MTVFGPNVSGTLADRASQVWNYRLCTTIILPVSLFYCRTTVAQNNLGRVARTNAFQVMFRVMMDDVDIELAPHGKKFLESASPTVVERVPSETVNNATYIRSRDRKTANR